MDFAIYYTLGAIILYGFTSWLINYIEESRGRRFKHRNIIFFVIIFALAVLLMNLINPPPQQQASPPPGTSAPAGP